jgi:hypothetical protein
MDPRSGRGRQWERIFTDTKKPRIFVSRASSWIGIRLLLSFRASLLCAPRDRRSGPSRTLPATWPETLLSSSILSWFLYLLCRSYISYNATEGKRLAAFVIIFGKYFIYSPTLRLLHAEGAVLRRRIYNKFAMTDAYLPFLVHNG